MLVLYITYIDFANTPFGSSVRPQKMYDAFLAEGHDVKLLSGSQDNAHRSIRRQSVREVNRWLDSHCPDFCYIESPVYPILLGADVRLIRRIHHIGIPIGYFYRDYHRKFPESFPRRKSVKELGIDLLQWRTDRVLRKADVVYFPSRAAADLFSYKDSRLLPPAGENLLGTRHPEPHTCIYVGSISRNYGAATLLEAFHILNSAGEEYPLILVTREKQWANKTMLPHREAPWLEVRHVSGPELEPLYERANLAMAVYPANAYNDLSISVKIYEYTGHGLPIVVSGAAAMEELVRRKGIGITAETSPESVAEAVKTLLCNTEEYARVEKNIEAMVHEEGLWVHRVRQVAIELTEKNKRN